MNFLNVDEKGTMVAEQHWIIGKTSVLNQPLYFKDVLTSQWKPGDVLHYGRGFALISTGEEKLWFEKEKSLETEKKQLIHRDDNHTDGKKPHKGSGRALFLSLQENTHLKMSRDSGYLDI